MIRYEIAGHGVTHPVISFYAAISACARGGQWHRALPLFSYLQDVGVTHYVISVYIDISASAKGWQWQRALSLLI